jgi:hypothetical protein
MRTPLRDDVFEESSFSLLRKQRSVNRRMDGKSLQPTPPVYAPVNLEGVLEQTHSTISHIKRQASSPVS